MKKYAYWYDIEKRQYEKVDCEFETFKDGLAYLANHNPEKFLKNEWAVCLGDTWPSLPPQAL